MMIVAIIWEKKKRKHYIKEPHKILRKKVHAFFNPKKKE